MSQYFILLTIILLSVCSLTFAGIDIQKPQSGADYVYSWSIRNDNFNNGKYTHDFRILNVVPAYCAKVNYDDPVLQYTIYAFPCTFTLGNSQNQIKLDFNWIDRSPVTIASVTPSENFSVSFGENKPAQNFSYVRTTLLGCHGGPCNIFVNGS